MSRYAFTLFLSAFLLFGVQPLVGKFALPWFGGTPAVWTACMLFFQAALLARARKSKHTNQPIPRRHRYTAT